MLYECSCGFSASTATSFYKHLAASKESAAGHQLVQARFTDTKSNTKGTDKKQDEAAEGAPSAPPSWVDEYLVVDQREATLSSSANSSLMATAAAAAASRGGALPPQVPRSNRVAPLPVSTSSASVTSQTQQQQRQQQQQPGVSQNTGATGARGDADGVVDVDEVELVERASSYGARGGPRVSGSGTAAAALRMSGTVMNAVAVGLSPWRWFSTGAVGGTAAGGVELDGAAAGAAGATGDVGSAGEFSQAGLSATAGGRSASLARTGGTGGGGLMPDQPLSAAASAEAIEAVQAVLLWHNPWRTGRIFGAGLYTFVCLRQLAKGHDLLQPSTALLAGCFLLLLRNVVREGMATYRRSQQQPQEGGDGSGAADAAQFEPPPSTRAERDAEYAQAAVALQQRVELALRRAALGAARYGAALFVLGAGLLSGRRPITSALVAALLWLGCVVGELRVMSQPTFWLLCYVGCFTIPAAYGRCRAAMDEGTEAALRFVVRLLVTGSRASLAMAGGVGVVLLAALPLNFVLRATLAAIAAFGVLLWQSEALAMAKAGMQGGAVGAGDESGSGQPVGPAGRPYLVEEEAKGGGGGGSAGGGVGQRVPLSHVHRE